MVVPYQEYHRQSLEAKDIDPSILCLRYISDRFELNTEQRYWIAFLYGTCYCSATTFYMYNEFPDYELVDVQRLNDWWSKNKSNLIFQTDRLRIKSNNQFVDSFVSYRRLCKGSPENYLKSRGRKDLYDKILKIKYFGRFSLFNYLDVLNQLTNINFAPPYLNMMEAKSCRDGLAFALEKPELIKDKMTSKEALYLHRKFIETLRSNEGNVFQIETTLCAYKKYRYGKRYVGYYIDRMGREIDDIQTRVNNGVYWDLLWQFRDETFDKKYLNERT